MSVLPLIALAISAAQPQPLQEPDVVLSSADCVTVHVDAEPWQQCGFQAMALNDAGDRVVTISNEDKVELWDRSGRRLAAVERRVPQSPGFPSGSVLFVGDAAVAIGARRQLVILDARTGAVRLDRDLGLVAAELLAPTGPRHVLIRNYRVPEWQSVLAVIDLADGRIVAERDGWPSGSRRLLGLIAGQSTIVGPLAQRETYLNNPSLNPAPLHDCAPIGPPLQCVRRQAGSRWVERLDGEGRRIARHKLPVAVGARTQISLIDAGGRLFASVCEPGRRPGRFINPSRCSLVDVERGRVLHLFRASAMTMEPGVDAAGKPEIRLATAIDAMYEGYEIRRIGADGRVTLVARTRRGRGYALALPQGGMMVPDGENAETALLLARDGSVRARLRLDPEECRIIDFSGSPARCAFSADGRTMATIGDTVALWTLPPF
ncbi:MAG TPA: hypothetical protein VF702_11980 [Allosphingosinicella sp.]